MRVYEKACDAEANGRPITSIQDYCYPIKDVDVVNTDNWKQYADFVNAIQLEVKSLNGVY